MHQFGSEYVKSEESEGCPDQDAAELPVLLIGSDKRVDRDSKQRNVCDLELGENAHITLVHWESFFVEVQDGSWGVAEVACFGFRSGAKHPLHLHW